MAPPLSPLAKTPGGGGRGKLSDPRRDDHGGLAAGGSVDLVARLVAQGLSDELGQSFVVENRAGAAGTVGHAVVARAKVAVARKLAVVLQPM
ncbi:tripartite tricarboxylate transporter substrate-binding protein [Pseudoroseomonas sp. WGS1072]|uniref:tripartite tricarboxylate transporter substrate-binding protein n=1 Tax=Roseomonas sp. WGS1072 TaxID=3366816 RepID=UPI003BF0B281